MSGYPEMKWGDEPRDTWNNRTKQREDWRTLDAVVTTERQIDDLIHEYQGDGEEFNMASDPTTTSPLWLGEVWCYMTKVIISFSAPDEETARTILTDMWGPDYFHDGEYADESGTPWFENQELV